MNGPLRSKQGCWTCRLRKKKCDEKHPFCSTCESLTITCYGYGPKPEWMDNGEKEKEIAHAIKQVVKHTSRRKGRLGTSINQLQKRYGGKKTESSVVKIAPKSIGASSSSSPGSNLEPDPPTGESSSSTHATPNTSLNSPFHESDHANAPSSIPLVAGNEAILLMHFLDNVFCLQYPLYRPGVGEGGRGWLLSLLLRTKPLYHASLALSAYHRSTMLVTRQSCPTAPSSMTEQEEHLAISLKELQGAIQNVDRFVTRACPTNSMGMMASTVQLIFFELFASQGDSWRIHLSAATTLFCGPYKIETARLGLDEYSATDVNRRTDYSEDTVIFKFLTAVIAWLDIISSITNAKLPRVIQLLPEEISSGSVINLEAVMGCKNWVMVQIGRISELHEFKTESIREGHVACEELGQRASIIKSELQNRLAESSISFLSISDPVVASACNPYITPQMFTTQLFALSASIYLHLVIFGYQQDSEDLKVMVSEAITLIRRHISGELTHALVCPLYIIGSAAGSEDESIFRHIFSSLPLLDPSLGHRAKFLPLLENIWGMRGTGWEWETNIHLSGPNLLLL